MIGFVVFLIIFAAVLFIVCECIMIFGRDERAIDKRDRKYSQCHRVIESTRGVHRHSSIVDKEGLIARTQIDGKGIFHTRKSGTKDRV